MDQVEVVLDGVDARLGLLRQRRAFVVEWERLWMPGEVVPSTLAAEPVNGQFVEVMEDGGKRRTYWLDVALPVLRDFSPWAGRTTDGWRDVRDALKEAGAIFG